MIALEVAKMARDTNEDVWRTACEIRTRLYGIGRLQNKVTGVGGWAIFVVLLALVASTVFTSYTLSYIASISHSNAEILVTNLVTRQSPHESLTLLHVVSFLIFVAPLYGIGYLLAKKLFGQKLSDARKSFNEFYLATDRCVFYRALFFIDMTEIASLGLLNKVIKDDYMAHRVSIANRAAA